MEKQSSIKQNITDLQNKIVNQALVVFSILGLVNQPLVILRALNFGFNPSTIIQITIACFLFILTFYRKKISLTSKITSLIIIILVVFISGLFSYGFLTSSKIYIVAIGIFVSFIVPFKQTLVATILYIFCFLLFAFLYTSGYLLYTFDVNKYVNSPISWIIDSSILVFTTLGLIYVGYNFRKVILDNYVQIEAQNIELINHRENLEKLVKERTEELETVNEELKSTNEELFKKNRIINDQNVELKTTLEHLKETQLQLMQSEKMASLGILTAGVAHEINNPLNFIVGGINGLENYLIKPENYSPEKITTLLGSIKIGVERTSAIVQSLNQFSRNNDSFEESYDIHTILESCLLMLNNKTKHRIEIVKDYFTETIPMIGNVSKIHQVFINILNNSIQSIDNEGSINIRTCKIEQNVIIEITDTGCGISTENISKITDPFFTTKDPGKGTGLGLSITYKIIQEHSGIIEFQSEINKGTIVKVTLPILKNL